MLLLCLMLLGIAYEKIMLNFTNTLTSKIISLAIAVSFILADISYAGAYQQGSLRVPMGEKRTLERVGKEMKRQSGAQKPAAALDATAASPAASVDEEIKAAIIKHILNLNLD